MAGLGLRTGDERRHGDRRDHSRSGRERRRSDRRRAQLRTLLLTAAALAAPHAIKVSNALRGPTASVTVDINSFDAVEARHAYDELIGEAAARYHLDPAMIR